MFTPPNLLHNAERASQAVGGQQSGIRTGPATILAIVSRVAICVQEKKKGRKDVVVLRLFTDVQIKSSLQAVSKSSVGVRL